MWNYGKCSRTDGAQSRRRECLGEEDYDRVIVQLVIVGMWQPCRYSCTAFAALAHVESSRRGRRDCDRNSTASGGGLVAKSTGEPSRLWAALHAMTLHAVLMAWGSTVSRCSASNTTPRLCRRMSRETQMSFVSRGVRDRDGYACLRQIRGTIDRYAYTYRSAKALANCPRISGAST